MKKVLIFSTLESVPWGGSEVLWHAMAMRMLDKGYKVMTNTIEWTHTPEPLAALKQKGAVVCYRPNLHKKGSISDAANNKVKNLEWKTQILEFAPDVILVSQGGAFDHALQLHGEWLKSLNVPLYVMAQYMNEYEYMPDARRNFFRTFMPQVDKMFFVSERNLKSAQRTLAQSIDNAVVIKNPIKLKETTTHYPGTDVYNIGVVARLESDIKGYDLIAEVFSQPQWKDRNVIVNVYGMGLHENYIKELLQYFQLEDKVILHGHESDIVNIWHHNHIFLLTSRGEGTPLSLLEAAYCKRAGIVTDIGGNAEIVDDGVSGFVAKAPAITCVAETMERAWEHRAEWEAMGLAAKKKIDTLYDTDVVEDAISLLV